MAARSWSEHCCYGTVSLASQGICTLCPELTLYAASQLPEAFMKGLLGSLNYLKFTGGMATGNVAVGKH